MAYGFHGVYDSGIIIRISVKSPPRYRYAYCRRISTRAAMEKHERQCFRNPERHCEYCNDTGKTENGMCRGAGDYTLCPYCAKYEQWKAHHAVAEQAYEDRTMGVI